MAKKDEAQDFTNSLFGVGGMEGAFNSSPPINPSVEIFGKVTKEIYSTKNLELKTELNDMQIMAFSQARAFAKRYKVPLLEEFVKNISKYSISRSRKGRKEFENIAKANFQMVSGDVGEDRSIPQRLGFKG